MLELGKIYTVSTAGDKLATCVYNLSSDRAIFAIQGFVAHFVSWDYTQPKDGTTKIDCFHGNYYQDIISALKGEGVL